MRVFARNNMDAQLVYSALEDVLEKYEHGKRTKYDGDQGYCKEDDDFLDDAIDRVRLMLVDLKRDHPYIVTKG